MSIASEITRLQGAKEDIIDAIESKGVTVPAGTKMDGLSTLINSIPSGGGEANVENVKFLANGLLYTDFPLQGSINGYTIDNTFPVSGLPVINWNNISSGGVYFRNDFIKNFLVGNTDCTLDLWFKGISHNYQYTPYFVGFSRLNESDNMLSCDYGNDLNNFLWTPFFPGDGGSRFSMTKDVWHHLAVEVEKINSNTMKLYIYVDGILKKAYNSYTHSDQEYYLKIHHQNGTNFSVGQICIREGLVWTENFTPPTEAYRIY